MTALLIELKARLMELTVTPATSVGRFPVAVWTQSSLGLTTAEMYTSLLSVS